MAQVASKVDYLGRGVDCREPKETWLDKLDHYGTEKIRDFSDGSVTEIPVKKNKIESRNEITESKKRVEGSVKATPHRGINLRGELKVKRDSSKMTKYKVNSHSTRIVTLKDDTSQDLDIIKREGTDPPIHYTEYEKKLSQFILEHIGTMQTEASTKGGEEATCLGKMIKDLKEGDSVARLEEYLQHARSQKELCQQIRQTLANACCSFINEKPYTYTHYVKSITLGAIKEESEESTDSHHDISAGIHATGLNVVDGSVEGGHQDVIKSKTTNKIERGEVQNGTVTAEEVIEASMEPVSSLINKKSKELKVTMERLLECYGCADQGILLGPFHVSCRKPLSQGITKRTIYWQVIGDEIYGATKTSEASTFYVQCSEEKSCRIIHKTSESETQYYDYVTVQRPFDTECPLKLVQQPEHQQDICFMLMNTTTKESVNIPLTENELKKGSPFFIKLPRIGIGLFKPQRYINVRKIIEKWKTKTGADSKAERTPASGATLDFTPPAATSEETKETRKTQTRASTPENIEYSTGSSASLDKPSQHVITTQFYFTPVGSVQGSRVIISGGPPPPPPSRIKSDSASSGDKVIRQQQEVDDIDAGLKKDFIELVGSEYVFPLPVRAVNIPDTQQ